MTTEERRLDLALQLANRNCNDLVQTLAQVYEERETLKARIAELEKQLSPKPEAPQDAQKQP